MATSKSQGKSLLLSSRHVYTGSSLKDAAYGLLTVYGNDLGWQTASGNTPARKLQKITGVEFEPIQSIADREKALATELSKILSKQLALANDLHLEQVGKGLELLDAVATVVFFVAPFAGMLRALVKQGAQAALAEVIGMLIGVVVFGDTPGGGAAENLQGEMIEPLAESLAKKKITHLQFSSGGKCIALNLKQQVIANAISFCVDKAIEAEIGNRNPMEAVYYGMLSLSPYVLESQFGPIGKLLGEQLKIKGGSFPKYRDYLKFTNAYVNAKRDLAEAHAFRLSVDPDLADKELRISMLMANITNPMPGPVKLSADFAKPGQTIVMQNYFGDPACKNFAWFVPTSGKGSWMSASIVGFSNGLVLAIPDDIADGLYKVAISPQMMMQAKILEISVHIARKFVWEK